MVSIDGEIHEINDLYIPLHLVMEVAEKTDGVWVWTTGWTIPSADATYKYFFRGNSTYIYPGEIIQVGNLEIGDVNIGFVGSAIIAVLESHGMPTLNIEMTSKSVEIGGEEYVILAEKNILAIL